MSAHVASSLFIAYLLLAVTMTSVLFLNGIVNFFVFKRPRAIVAPDEQLPFISILVPARNEEQVIERCVRSLLNQNYANFELLVLDDNSEDTTYDILCHIRDQDPKLRVLAGAALPDGWCGKPFACWQLAHAAHGDFLLMTDADCEFSPDALLMAVGGIAEHQADVLSLCPDYIAVTFWERLLIPLLVVIAFAFLPIAFVRGTRISQFSAANGAFLFMRRSTYLEIDGHRAVRNQLAEDVKFAQHVKRVGKTIWYGDGQRAYRVRMYDSLPDLWQGFTRILFPAFSAKLAVLIPTLIFLAVTLVLPPFIALAGWLIGAPWSLLALLPYVMIVALRLAIALVFGRDTIDSALLNPIGWLMTIVIAVASVVKNGTGIDWKGRVYVEGRRKT